MVERKAKVQVVELGIGAMSAVRGFRTCVWALMAALCVCNAVEAVEAADAVGCARPEKLEGIQDSGLSILLDDVAVSSDDATPFLGVNTLYTLEGADVWKAGLAGKLKSLGVGSLRYPGGEVADGYDWDLAGPERGAGSLDLDTIDYQEFLAHAAETGARHIYFVINVEGAFARGGDISANLVEYADKAAKVVSAVKKSGHAVKYWEIGNESYHAGTTYPLRASEYARALKVFAASMRKADPSIRILANGPPGLNAPGFADRLGPDDLVMIRDAARFREYCGKRRRKDCLHQLGKQTVGATAPVGWWEVLARDAKGSFDGAAVHTYATAEPIAESRKGFRETHRLIALKSGLATMLGRPVEVTVTEWNSLPERRGGPVGAELITANAVKFGNLMAAGVEDAIFWPLRYTSADGANLALLGFSKLEELPMYRAMGLINTAMRGTFVSQATLGAGVYSLRVRTESGLAIMLVNRSGRSERVSLDSPSVVWQADIMQLGGDLMQGGRLCVERVDGNGAVIKLGPQSVTTLKLKPIAVTP